MTLLLQFNNYHQFDKIERPIPIKIESTQYYYMSQMLSNNMKISYVELPKTVSLILKKNFNVHTEKFFPKTQEIITSNNITSNNIISNNIGSISIT